MRSPDRRARVTGPKRFASNLFNASHLTSCWLEPYHRGGGPWSVFVAAAGFDDRMCERLGNRTGADRQDVPPPRTAAYWKRTGGHSRGVSNRGSAGAASTRSTAATASANRWSLSP